MHIDLINRGTTYVRIFFAVLLVLLLFNTYDVYAAASIKKTSADLHVIPDKVNTTPVQPKTGFKQITNGSTIKIKNTNGKNTNIQLQSSMGMDRINLTYANKDIEGTFIFENYDFSSIDSLMILGASYRNECKRKVEFVFKNCKFRSFFMEREASDYVACSFERCSFYSFVGSNSKFQRCYFGGGIQDRIVPFCRVTLNDCYIANPTSSVTDDGEVHVDGTQIYAWNTTEAYDIHFSRCRFEMPILKYPNAPHAYVNACIMLYLEYNSGHDISFTDCYVNGGGMCVYANTKYDNLTLRNVTFKNMTFGCSQKYKWLYPRQASSVDFNLDTWKSADSIYVGQVYHKESSNETRIVVTNDTNKKRKFKVFTSDGKSYDFEIDACPLNKNLNDKRFEDLPIDKIYSIPGLSKWVVCYETTDGKFKQVRYKNWTKKELVLLKNKDGSRHVVEKPVSTATKKLTVSGKSVIVKWNKKKNTVDGYQIQYSKDSKFAKGKYKKAVIKSGNINKCTIKGLQRKEKYYFRIRTYKKIKVGNQIRYVYGSWSKMRSISTK